MMLKLIVLHVYKVNLIEQKVDPSSTVELYNNKFRDLLAGQMDDNNNSSSKKGRRGASDNNLRNSHEFNNGSLRNSRDRGLKGPRIELHESPT